MFSLQGKNDSEREQKQSKTKDTQTRLILFSLFYLTFPDGQGILPFHILYLEIFFHSIISLLVGGLSLPLFSL